ncbi:MAG: NADH dehydrogenase ubiquinone Fe-S protein 4 [Alphaproteobacteria bacterium]
MKAIIYSPNKTATQSKLNNTSKWKLEFIEQKGDRYTEPLMGRISSANMHQELNHIFFDTKEAAIKYAEMHLIEYEIKAKIDHRLTPKSYEKNFKS